MASQNYQNRNKNRKRSAQSSSSAFSWMLITGLLIGLVVLGLYLKENGLKKISHQLQHYPITAPVVAKVISPTQQIAATNLSPATVEKLEQHPDSLPPEVANELASETPQFEFYTILPEKEVLIPENEIMTRVQQEHLATQQADSRTSNVATTPTPNLPVDAPAAQAQSNSAYMMQAGSFKNSVDAEKMRANLEAMGIEARVEKGKVGETIYHRIKMGPYAQMNSVNAIRTRLKQNGIDVIVTETAH